MQNTETAEKSKISTRDAIDLILLGAVWGGSFLFMKIAGKEFGPVAMIELRVIIASLFLIPVLWVKHEMSELTDNKGALLFLGIVNSAIPFSLFAYATLNITTGFASILNSTAPFFAAIIAWFWIKSRLNVLQVLGLLVGFTGSLILVWGRVSFKEGGSGLAIVACLVATFFYGIAANFSKIRLSTLHPTVVAAGSQLGAAIFLLPFAIFWMPSTMPSLKAWLAVLASGVLSTGIAYIYYFRLISNIGATRAIAVTFLIPMFGIFWGYIVLGEVLSLNMGIGVFTILCGMALTTGLIRSRKS